MTSIPWLWSRVLWLAVLGAACRADAFSVYKLGGEDGNPWKAGVSFDPGQVWVLDTGGRIVRRDPVATPTDFATSGDTLTELVDSVAGVWLRPFFIPDTLNLARDGVRNRIARGISDNIVTSGTCYNNISQVTKTRPMFDNDPTTAAFYTANASDDPEIRRGFYIENTIVDLGVDYPINRIRFFPRIGRSNPKLGEILDAMTEPRLGPEQLPEEDFSGNFLPWFELAGANSVNNFAANCYWQTAESPFFRGIEYIQDAEPDSRWEILLHETENLNVVVDVRFPTRLWQWVTVRPVNPIGNWEIAEFQVFGEGFVPRAVYLSSVLDFGQPVALGKIRWDGALDAESRILIRTRAGSDPDPQLYWTVSTIPGELKQLSRQEWERADITTRTVTLDEDNWSFWSSPYDWDAGRLDPGADPGLWTDGTPVLSPGPARYLQVQVVFLSTSTGAARLRQLEVQVSPPSALRVLGEIWPLDAARDSSTAFTYTVLPFLDNDEQGFDHLEILTLTRADAVRSVRVDGVEVSATFPPQILDDRIIVSLPELRGAKDTFKLVEVEFDTRVVRYGTEFTGWVYDSQSSGVKQLIEAGDATVEYPGNALGVRTGDLGARLISAVWAGPNPFTPNGDGENDEALFRFQVHELSTPRALELTIYDLTGRAVRRLDSRQVVRGIFGESSGALSWNGLDEGGQRVSPGLYVYRIALDTDGGQEERLGTLAVAY